MLQVQHFQLEAWKRFFEREVEEFISSFNYTKQGVTVKFRPSNTEKFKKIQHPRGLRDIYDIFKVNIEISVVNNVSFASSHVYPDVPLAALPIMTQDGIVLGGTKYGATSNLVPAGGWYQINKVVNNNTFPALELRSITIPKWTFTYRKGRLFYEGSGGSKESLSILTFIKAMSPSLSLTDIVELFDSDPLIWNEYLLELENEMPIDDCAKAVFTADGSNLKSYDNAATILQTRIYKDNSLRIGAERLPRFKNFMSFTKALGLTLARQVEVDGVVIPANTVLSAGLLRKIDESPLTDLYVYHDSTEKHLYKTIVCENISFDEIVCAIHHFCLFCNNLGVVDKQDNYCNKVLEPIGRDIELFLTSAMKSLISSINEKFARDDITSIELPSDVLNRSVDIADFKKHLQTSRSYKLLDQVNSIATFEQAFRVNGGASKNIPASARDVQKSQYGCVCPYTTSESDRVGLNLSLSTLAHIDSYGFISTPALSIMDGKVGTDEIYLSTIEARGHIFAPFDVDIPKVYAENPDSIIKGCRLNGELIDAKLSEIDYQDVSPLQVFGPLVANVPSAERDAGKRLLMAGSAQKQAIPTWRRERPWVTTALEAVADIGVIRAREIVESGLMERDFYDAVGDDVTLYLDDIRQDGNVNILQFRCTHPELTDTFEYTLHNMSATIKGTPKHSRVNFKKNDRGELEYNMDDIVIYANDIECQDRDISTDSISFGKMERSSDVIANHALALGNNVRVLFKSYDGWGYEDSIIVRQGFVSAYGLAILTTYDVREELNDDEKFAYNTQNGEVSTYMQPNGLPRIGTFLKSGQDIIGKAVYDERGQVVKWTTQKLDIKVQGYVVSASIFEDGKVASVTVGDISILGEGDKLAGVHGNKGVVGKIVPDYEMPFSEDGEIADIILNPLGVISRNNLGQMIELTEAAIGENKGEIQVLPPFSGKRIGEITGDALGCGIMEKDIYDGRTGLKFPKKAMIGIMHILRLEHTSTSKYKACSTGDSAINPRTLQINGKQGGAQKISELGSWCLNSYGADGLLDTFFTVQCDDIINKGALASSIKDRFSSHLVEYKSSNLDFLNAYFRLLGLNLEWHPDGMRTTVMTSQKIRDISNGDCDLSFGDPTMPQGPYYMIRDPRIFGSWGPSEADKIKSRVYYGRLPLLCEVVMPIWLKSHELGSLIWYLDGDPPAGKTFGNRGYKPMSAQTFSSLLKGEKYVAEWQAAQFMSDDMELRMKTLSNDLGFELEFPIIKSATPEIKHDIDYVAHSRISGIVEIFKRYSVWSTVYKLEELMATEQGEAFIDFISGNTEDLDDATIQRFTDVIKNENRTIERHNRSLTFAQSQSLSEFVVDAVAVPPVGYRPMFGDKPATAMDNQLRGVIAMVRQLRSTPKDSNIWYDQVAKVYQMLASMMTDEDTSSRNKSVMSELTDHGSHASVMRDTLLAKRVSHSGRSVISINPKLKFGHAGIPVSIASKILEDHIVAELRHNADEYPNIAALHINTGVIDARVPHKYKKMIVFLANNNINGFAEFVGHGKSVYKTFCACRHELIVILRKLFQSYPALLSRDPALHKFSYMGFDGEPVLTYSLQLPPLACHAFNADFDGDQMAVYLAQHERGIRDIREKMMQQDNIINPKDCEMIVALNQDIILGLYYCSMYPGNAKTLDRKHIKAYYNVHGAYTFDGFKPMALPELYDDLMMGRVAFQDTVLVRNNGNTIINSAGRVLLNAMIPSQFGFTDMHMLEVSAEQRKSMSNEEQSLLDELMAKREKELTNKDIGLSDAEFRKDPRYAALYEKYTVKWNGLPLSGLTFDFLVKKDSIKKITKFVSNYFELYGYHEDRDGDTFGDFLDRVKSLGFYCADYSGTTLSLYDFERLPIGPVVEAGSVKVTEETDAIQQMYNDGMITDAERSQLTIQAWTTYRQQLTKDIDTCFRGGKPGKYTFNFDNTDNIFMIVDSGARGDTYQLVEIAGLIGNVTNASGETLETPIRSNYLTGLSVSEAFSNSYASRRDVMAAQLSTKDAGTLTRELIYDVEHLHTRDSDQFCGADSSEIPLEYDALLRENVGVKLAISNASSVPLSLWQDSKIAAAYKARYNLEWNPEEQRRRYLEFTNDIKNIFPFDYVSPELNHLLTIKKIPYIVVDDGTFKLSPVTYTLKNRSKYMLFYRVIDLDKLAPGVRERLFELREDVIAGERLDVDGEKQEYTLGPAEDYCVIGDEMISEIERLHLDSVHIWTIVGCNSTHGICKKCYGIKYDTKQFPGNLEYVGYQGIQSIGEPLAQIVLDAHKRSDGGQDGGSKAKLHQLMSDPHGRSGTAAKLAPMGGVVSITRNGAEMQISIDGTPVITFSDMEALKVLDGQTVSAGDILVDGNVDYNNMRDLAGYQKSQIAFWTDFLKVFNNQKIMARNFELLARAQTEFGVALEAADDILIGSLYPQTTLLNAGVKFVPQIIKSDKAINVAGKVMAGIAHSNMASRSVYHVINGTKGIRDSNIGRTLIGDIKTNPFVEPMGVVVPTKKVRLVATPKVRSQRAREVTAIDLETGEVMTDIKTPQSLSAAKQEVTPEVQEFDIFAPATKPVSRTYKFVEKQTPTESPEDIAKDVSAFDASDILPNREEGKHITRTTVQKSTRFGGGLNA